MKNKLIFFGLIGFFIIGLTLIINKSERPNKQTLNWFNGNLKEAYASLGENQIIMLDFYINNWNACNLLDAKTFTNQKLIDLSKTNLVSLKVNGYSNYGETLSKKFNVKKYPEIILLKKENNKLVKVNKINGYINSTELIIKIEQALAANNID